MNKNRDHISNETLVYRYQSGDKEALRRLIKRFHPILIRQVIRYTRDHEPVDDIAQDIWYVIIRKLREVEFEISFNAWALTIAQRKAIDWVREQQRTRKKRYRMAEEQRMLSNKGGEESEETRAGVIRKKIYDLPESQQVVLEMFYREGLTLKEISDVLKVPEGTVKSRLFHAREYLKDCLK